MKQARRFISLAVAHWVCAAGGLTFCATGWGAQLARGRQFPELRLKNGTVLHDVTVVAVGSTTIVARWDGGQGSILVRQLPAELQAEMPLPVVAKTEPAAPAAPADFDMKLASAEIPTEIKLTNGFVMHKSAVTRWDTNSVLISYQGGIVSVRFSNISPDQRAIFEARKDEALARQAREDSSSSAGQDTAAREEQARQATETQARDEADRKADEIRNGISFHYLVKGMTKDQVKQAFGGPAPSDDHGDSIFYPNRGKDKYGNSADRVLVFKDGLLAGWRDEREGEPDGAVEH